MNRMHRPLLLNLLGCGLLAAAAPLREAPNMAATPANQLLVSGNACGPAALLNAFRFGNDHWQRGCSALDGRSDREQILQIIRGPGARPSAHTPGRLRWSRRGVNLADLRDIANELTRGQYLPPLNEEVFFLMPRETPMAMLRRVHQRLETSLARGLPPVLSLRRYALRAQPGRAAQWTVIDAHFVTLTAIPRRLDKHAGTFTVRYLDPWGGKSYDGRIAIPRQPLLADQSGVSTCLVAEFPQSSVGGKLVRRGETSVLVPAAALGRW